MAQCNTLLYCGTSPQNNILGLSFDLKTHIQVMQKLNFKAFPSLLHVTPWRTECQSLEKTKENRTSFRSLI